MKEEIPSPPYLMLLYYISVMLDLSGDKTHNPPLDSNFRVLNYIGPRSTNTIIQSCSHAFGLNQSDRVDQVVRVCGQP